MSLEKLSRILFWCDELYMPQTTFLFKTNTTSVTDILYYFTLMEQNAEFLKYIFLLLLSFELRLYK